MDISAGHFQQIVDAATALRRAAALRGSSEHDVDRRIEALIRAWRTAIRIVGDPAASGVSTGARTVDGLEHTESDRPTAVRDLAGSVNAKQQLSLKLLGLAMAAYRTGRFADALRRFGKLGHGFEISSFTSAVRVVWDQQQQRGRRRARQRSELEKTVAHLHFTVDQLVLPDESYTWFMSVLRECYDIWGLTFPEEAAGT
jgi:surfactin synthase thioesterase subunit